LEQKLLPFILKTKKEYKAIIEEEKDNYFLVRYVDFGEQREWLTETSMKIVSK